MQRAQHVAACVLALMVAACTKKANDDPSVLAAQDLVSSGASFDPNEILDPDSMQDYGALDAGAIQQFLLQTPYGGASFLASYASNGVSASAAIASAAQMYTLDPIVLLVRAEMDDGLIAAANYPSPASRVEFAFGCGCSAAGDCDPTYAGFDVQVACLGAALRDNLDAVAAEGQTLGGWAPNVPSTTLDGVVVTPNDDSTAALYQYTPLVAAGKAAGNWLFWNLWQTFASALSYSPPSKPAGPAAWIGDGCEGAGQCSYEGTAGTCAAQYPGGLCTLACTASCPSSSSQTQTFCADFGSQGGLCLSVCNPHDAQCRAGYGCQSVKRVGDATTSQFVCFPM